MGMFDKGAFCGYNAYYKTKKRGTTKMKNSAFKKILCALLCVLLLFFLFPTALAAGKEEKAPLAVAHRGYSADAPENTLASIRRAGEEKYYGCEFDIHPTKDDVWVVMHDDTVDRMTNGSGKISDLSLDEIKALKINAGNNIESYPDEKVPTLEQALFVCAEYGLHPVIEIKNGDENELKELVSVLEKAELQNGYTIISFVWEVLKPIRELLPQAELWMLANEVKDVHINFCLENKIDGISFNYKKNTVFSIGKIRSAGLKMIAWTVDGVFAARSLSRLGVSAVTTNRLLPGELDFEKLSPREFLKIAFEDFLEDVRAAFKNLSKRFGIV